MSHGHYDHTGGLLWATQQLDRIEVIAHPETPEKPPPYIGCPFSRRELEQSGAIFHFVGQTEEIAPGLWFVTGIDRDPGKSPKDARLVLPTGDGLGPDPIEDDASLIVDTDGLVGVSHCTGFEAAVALHNRCGVRFAAASAGKIFTF
ncbi:MAG: hypothetical protein ACLFUL_10570 [Desulfobacteraceae bacterium]